MKFTIKKSLFAEESWKKTSRRKINFMLTKELILF